LRWPTSWCIPPRHLASAVEGSSRKPTALTAKSLCAADRKSSRHLLTPVVLLSDNSLPPSSFKSQGNAAHLEGAPEPLAAARVGAGKRCASSGSATVPLR